MASILSEIRRWWTCKRQGHLLCPCDWICWGEGRSPCLRELGRNRSPLYAALPGTPNMSVDEPGYFPSPDEYDALCKQVFSSGLGAGGMHLSRGSSHGRSK